MKEVFTLAWKLLLISLLAGLLLGATNEVTKGPIALQAQEEFRAACQEVFPAAEEIREVGAGQVEKPVTSAVLVYDGQQELLGVVLNVVGRGYGGDLPVTVGIDVDGKVTGIRIGANSETAGLGSRVGEAAFTDRFKGLSAAQPLTLNQDVDAISGVTVSSRAVLAAVNAAAETGNAILAAQRP